MTFVDTLAFQLFTLAIVSGLLFYSGVIGYFTYRRYGARRTLEHLKGQAVPLGGIGVVIFSIGMWGEIAWPLPGSYNILFFDPYLLLGVVLMGFAISVMLSRPTQYVGFFAAMVGLLSMYYGVSAYQAGLTKEPLTMLFLYVALGGTALFTFPVTLWLDRMVMSPSVVGASQATDTAGGTSPAMGPMSTTVKILVGGFLLFLLFAAGSAILAIIIGGGALPSHLIYAP